MNALVQLHNGTVVCGNVQNMTGHICLRPVGHWGPHVVKTHGGTYMLMQTVCSPISFEIPEVIANAAIKDEGWSWQAD